VASQAFRTEKERMFTAVSVVRGEGAVKRHYLDLNNRCTFIADAISAIGTAGWGPCCRYEADACGSHGENIRRSVTGRML
jgi:hypothetical protein